MWRKRFRFASFSSGLQKNPVIIAVFASNSIFSMTDYLNCDFKLNYGCILQNSIVSNKLSEFQSLNLGFKVCIKAVKHTRHTKSTEKRSSK